MTAAADTPPAVFNVYGLDSSRLHVGELQVSLTKGYSTIIDLEDTDLTTRRWNSQVNKNKVYARRYRKEKGQRSLVYLHRVIMERKLGRPLEKGEQVDHIDGDSLNNRRSNLRLATRGQNCCNTRMSSRNTSGYKGVSWSTTANKWLAAIVYQKQHYTLGYFTSPIEAHEAYKRKAVELFGEFANFGESKAA